MIEVAKDRIEDLFLSFNQFSFTADGCQLIYNLARQLLAENPGWTCVAGDESSAFQLALRPEMRRQLMEHFPEFIPYFSAAYDTAAGLYYEDEPLPEEQCQNGCQQGCSLGTFLHGLAQLTRTRTLIANNPDCVFLLLCDDVFILGPPEAVALAVARAFGEYKEQVETANGHAEIWQSCNIHEIWRLHCSNGVVR